MRCWEMADLASSRSFPGTYYDGLVAQAHVVHLKADRSGISWNDTHLWTWRDVVIKEYPELERALVLGHREFPDARLIISQRADQLVLLRVLGGQNSTSIASRLGAL